MWKEYNWFAYQSCAIIYLIYAKLAAHSATKNSLGLIRSNLLEGFSGNGIKAGSYVGLEGLSGYDGIFCEIFPSFETSLSKGTCVGQRGGCRRRRTEGHYSDDSKYSWLNHTCVIWMFVFFAAPRFWTL